MANAPGSPAAVPKFYITIEAIRCTRDDWYDHGIWRPSAHPSAHRTASNRTPLCFAFNGRRTVPVDDIPDDCTVFRTSTLYHHGGIFWIVDRDARVMAPPADDDESGSGDDSGGEDGANRTSSAWLDWVQPTFHLVPQDRTSYAGYRLPFPRLLAQRSDQEWVRRVFPSGYRAEQNSGQGGLIGDLSLLVGLLVMSIPNQDDDILSHLPRMILHDSHGRACWQSPPLGIAEDRGIGCKLLFLLYSSSVVEYL